MNLIEDQWVRCIRYSDKSPSRIAPHQITQAIDSPYPIIDVIADRPDFKGALYQFLIGLLQTITPPKDEKEWRSLWQTPPTPENLKERFTPMSKAFDLDSEGPAFMQDFDLLKGETKPISALLIDAPGGKTLRDNLDHFVKRDKVESVCYSCAALALFTLQANAPSGGVGHRVGLRGGGPLTTLLSLDETFVENSPKPPTLWHKLWLNVLPENALHKVLDDGRYGWNNNSPTSIFPWLGPTRTSETKTGCETSPQDAHPYQMYWGMPRRIRINFSVSHQGTCDLCGDTGPLVYEFVTKNYGVNYTGIWKHPLTPYARRTQENEPLPLHGQKGGITYRNWLGLTLGDRDQCQAPAKTVDYFLSERVRPLKMDLSPRIWAFGYDMDNMKARCWYDAKMPLYEIDLSIRDTIKDFVIRYIDAAIEMAGNLRREIKNARYKRPGDVKGDWSFIDIAFWQATESSFYNCIQEATNALGKNEALHDIQKRGHSSLKRSAMALFDEHALGGPLADMDMGRVVRARQKLAIWLETGKKVKELLGKG